MTCEINLLRAFVVAFISSIIIIVTVVIAIVIINIKASFNVYSNELYIAKVSVETGKMRLIVIRRY